MYTPSLDKFYRTTIKNCMSAKLEPNPEGTLLVQTER
jgi:hypothetical protein